MANRQWFHDPIRLVHTILRSCDAPDYDAKASVEYAKRMHGNSIVINGGGLYAFYPTKIELQRVVAGLTTDVVGDVVEEAHRNGLRVLGRVDFRGGHPEAFHAHPDWFSVDANGEPVVVNGFHTAPVTSPYRNDGYGFRVVHELLESYDLDGIWENAPGFSMGAGAGPLRVDYGPSVRRRFRADTGLELPRTDDATYRTYLRWRYSVMREHAQAFHELVKSFGDDKAYVAEFPAMLDVGWGSGNGQDLADVGPYWDIVTAPTFDVLRGSYGSNTYPTPVWRAEESAKYLGAVNPSVPPTVLFGRFDNQSRYTAVAGEELRVWLAGALAHGAGFWECTFVGRYGEEFLDQRNEDVVREYYALLDERVDYYRDARPVADVAVVHSQPTQDELGSDDPRRDGYVQHVRGVLATLFAEHIPFDVLPEARLTAETLARYRVVILPNTAVLDEGGAALLRAYVDQGGGVVATYETSLLTADGEERPDYLLADVFGVTSAGVRTPRLPYAYTLLRERDELTAGFDDTRIVTNTGRVRVVYPNESARVPATLVPEIRPQPPEHGWRADLETPIPVVVGHEFGAGRSAFFPGQTDRLALESGHPDYGRLLANAVDWAGAGERLVRTDAPDSVHVSVTAQAGRERRVVHLVNYTSGPHRPIRQVVPCTELTVELRCATAPRTAHSVRTGDELPVAYTDGYARVAVPRLEVYEAIALDW